MNLTAALRARLSLLPGDELGQAILRIGLLLVVMLYVLWYVSLRVSPVGEHDTILLTGLAAWLILAIATLAAIWIWPAPNAPRRVLGIFADAGVITFGLFLAGESGAMLVGLYLFMIFGNGFRYGRFYLHLCQVFCLTGFVLVELMVPWWRHQQVVVAMGWMISMVVLPFYVSGLAKNLVAARMKAEGALKERIERERGDVA